MTNLENRSVCPDNKFVFSSEQSKIHADLWHGLRDQRDPVTVRTFLVDVGHLMGVEYPEWDKIPKKKWEETRFYMEEITKDTLWAPLTPEYLESLGVEVENKSDLIDLKLLVANGRHKAEPLWNKLTERVAKKHPGRVAKFNPVGHYNDGQPRVAGPRMLLRNLDTFVVLGSTQTEKGGSLEVVSHVSRLIRNPDFSLKIDNLAVVLPFFGGSRGHREGQREDLVYEILEMISNPKILALPMLEAKAKLWWDVVKEEFGDKNPMGLLKALLGKNLPKIKVVSVDIHNDDLPARKFKQMGIEFVNADPTRETSKETIKIVNEEGLSNEAWLVMASDEGAIPRTNKFAKNMLLESGKTDIYVGSIDKTRLVAGKVDDVRMGRIERWTLVGGEIEKIEVKVEEFNRLFDEGVVLVKSDDMVDTGGTNRKDESFLRKKMNVLFSVTVATHPVFSKGMDVLDGIGSDYYIFTNTLIHNGLSNRDNVMVVDASASIARALGFE